jgi:predicted MFS family arabinose efflux permease
VPLIHKSVPNVGNHGRPSNNGTSANDNGSSHRLAVTAMIIATSAVAASSTILTLFIVDIASTFNVPVGVASQLATVNYAGEFFFSILLSALVIRFRYKPLILAGVLVTVVSAIGNFFAPDLLTMQIFFVLEGIGSVIVGVMSLTLFGDLFSPKKRAKMVSYLAATLWITALISFPWAGLIANVVGWRFVFILHVLPISLVGLILAFFFVPSKILAEKPIAKETSYPKSYKQVLTNKSATACLVATVIAASGGKIGLFGVALYRQQFLMSLDFTVAVSLSIIVINVFGSFVAGRLTSRFGAKPMAISGRLLSGVFTMMFFLVPNLWVALLFDFLQVWFASLAAPSYQCLALAQVPKSRGTMMALNHAMGSLSRTIVPAIGGVLLVWTLGFYGALGLAFGVMTIASAIILLLLAKEPIEKTIAA